MDLYTETNNRFFALFEENNYEKFLINLKQQLRKREGRGWITPSGEIVWLSLYDHIPYVVNYFKKNPNPIANEVLKSFYQYWKDEKQSEKDYGDENDGMEWHAYDNSYDVRVIDFERMMNILSWNEGFVRFGILTHGGNGLENISTVSVQGNTDIIKNSKKVQEFINNIKEIADVDVEIKDEKKQHQEILKDDLPQFKKKNDKLIVQKLINL